MRICIVVPRLPVLVSELIPNTLEERLKLWLRLTVGRRPLAAAAAAGTAAGVAVENTCISPSPAGLAKPWHPNLPLL